MGRMAHLCNAEESGPAAGKRGTRASRECRPLRIIVSPSMTTPIASTVLGLIGLALAWESVAALLVALAIGLAVAAVAVARTGRDGASPERPLAERSARARAFAGHQSALLRAAQVLSGELELETVLQRLADELAALLQADAADCYLYDESATCCAAQRCTASTTRSSASSSRPTSASPARRSARAVRSPRPTTRSSRRRFRIGRTTASRT